MNIILLGKPGAGKGFIAQHLENECGFKHISTGELCRKHIKEKSDLGKIINEYTSKGLLVPMDIILKMLKQEVRLNKGKDIIFDGFPRNIDQAVELEKITKIDAVILVDVPDKILLKRIEKRRICSVCSTMCSTDEAVLGKCPSCGGNLVVRADDDLEVAKKRLVVYEKETKPLINFYKGKLVTIDNSGSIDTLKNIINILLN